MSPRRWLVVCAVALLLTGTVTPAVGTPKQSAAWGSAAEPSVPAPAPDRNGSAVERKKAAAAALESLTVERRDQRRHRDRALDRLSESIATHRDGDRVRSREAFRHDRRALSAMAGLGRANRSRVEEAADLVVAADRVTAEAAIDDAGRAYRRFGGRLDDPDDRRRVRRSLDRAEQAFDRGLAALGDNDGRGPRSTERRRAVGRFETAWRRAQRVLDVLDRATEPTITITTRADPPWNGSGARTRTVRGSVSAVKPYDVADLLVSVNGTTAGRATLDAPTAPARNASFAVNVTLDGGVAEVTLSAPTGDVELWERDGEREDRHLDRRARGRGSGGDGREEDDDRGGRRNAEDDDGRERGDEDGDREGAHGDRGRSDDDDDGEDGPDEDGEGRKPAATAVVRFDGDGLPDTYEGSTVGTDPLDPDSDTSRTEDGEGNDGVPDGGEDFDGDRLITFAEFDRGSDPFAADTDADGLGDRFEASLPTLDPATGDSDGDAIPDGAEDFDGDGLVAAAERANGTSIVTPDTDRDGLDDGAEVLRHGTSPVVTDTDRDGLGDGEELAVGTDPTVRDTDADGVVDGNETFATSTVERNTGVSVVASGEGDVASGLAIEPVSQPPGLDVVSGPVVRIRNRTRFDHATVSLPVADDVPPADVGNLTVFKWTPGSDRPWRPVESTVDRADGTVRANVSSFSYFAVMDERRWREVTEATVRVGWPRFEGFDALDGWSVEGRAAVENGSLVISGGSGPDLVVASDGSGDFRRIQPAVDAASDGDTIEVRRGTYPEEVVLHTSVRLVGREATLDGSGLSGERTGLTVVDGTQVTVSGLDIEGYEQGVAGAYTSADVRLEGVTFRDTRFPVVAGDSTGDWSLFGVTATGTEGFAVTASGAAGDWTVSKANLADGGVLADGTTGDWTVSDATISGRYDGIDAWEFEGEWTVRRSVLSGSEDGFDGNGATGNATFADIDASGNERGIVGFLSTGNWTLLRTDQAGNEDYGVYAGFATGAWTIRASNVSGNGVNGVSAGHTEGDWTLLDVTASDNGYIGVNAYLTAGDWRLSNVEASRNAGWSGVYAYGSSGNWTVSDVDLSANAEDGLAPTATSGNWQVTSAVLTGNGADGLDAAGAGGELSIARSAVHDNGRYDVNGDGSARPVRAAEVWWGQPGGPAGGQVNGAVRVEAACAEATCAPAGIPVDAFDGAAGAGIGGTGADPGSVAGPSDTSRVSRGLSLPAGLANATIRAVVSGRAEPGASAALRLRDGQAAVTVGELTSGVNGSRVLTAAVGRFVGETASLEVVADRGATVAVDWIEVVYDADGDGLRDLVENAAPGLPVGPVPGAPLDALDPSNPDSDGDGVPDGGELTDVHIARRADEQSGVYVVRAVGAMGDPTAVNSDGGGLNDSEELAAGSDPFVLETLVAGFAIPTMTEGPEETVEDGNPMTVAEANGLQVGGGAESDLVAWPSRQFFDPLFCIKELTAGPGCAPEWMRGVEVRDARHYVYVPFLVYLQSNVDLSGVAYEMTFEPATFVNDVKQVNSSGELDTAGTRLGYVVYELPDEFGGVEGQPRAFRPIGGVKFRGDFTGTIFERENDERLRSSFSVSTSTLLPKMEQVLKDTRFVLSQGLTVATAAETGYSVVIRTGSVTRGALAFLFDFVLGQIETSPTSAEDLGKETADEGIASFQQTVHDTQNEIKEDIFGDGVVRPVGRTMLRYN